MSEDFLLRAGKFLFGVFLLALAAIGFWKKSMETRRGGALNKSDEPFFYWLSMVGYIAIGVWLLVSAVTN